MKFSGLVALSLFTSHLVFSQNSASYKPKDRKGNLYFYYGWNRAWYSKSDIHFTGSDYDFELENVVAHDRQSPFSADTYMNPMNISIPQYNFRVGYFISNHYDISFGIDHMKYVMDSIQTVKISGEIANSSPYAGTYYGDDFIIEPNFLKFEHTDGLNFVNSEIRRFDEIYGREKFSINLTEGLGAGILYPRTNTTLFNNNGHDEFHVAGFGLSAVTAINFTFFKHFFLQTEFKGGYINMPDVETTYEASDKASQDFFFFQYNFVIGASINLWK